MFCKAAVALEVQFRKTFFSIFLSWKTNVRQQKMFSPFSLTSFIRRRSLSWQKEISFINGGFIAVDHVRVAGPINAGQTLKIKQRKLICLFSLLSPLYIQGGEDQIQLWGLVRPQRQTSHSPNLSDQTSIIFFRERDSCKYSYSAKRKLYKPQLGESEFPLFSSLQDFSFNFISCCCLCKRNSGEWLARIIYCLIIGLNN